MTTTGDERQRIETYLGSLRLRLRGFKDQDVREIVEELRSHIVDKVASGDNLDGVLAGLGSPEELASQYTTDDLLARAEVSRSPFRILEGLFRWASLSLAGFFVLLGSIVGYFVGGAFVLCALLKSFHPHTAGLWLLPDATGDSTFSLRLGFSSAPAGGRELLGWWMIPVGLAVGGGLVMLTTRFALWCVQRYRRSRVLPRGAHA
jgi:hypothetical protein